MLHKQIIWCMAALLAFSSVAFCQKGSGKDPNAAADVNAPAKQTKQIMVFYFHRTIRCPTCRTIEALSKEAVEKNFSKEIKADKLIWITANIDDPNYKALAQRYDVTGSALLIVDSVDGEDIRHKELKKVWDLVGDRKAFTAYVKKEIANYMITKKVKSK
ncbi:MAG: hypothetical protein A2Y07_07200 [Planctomycetes bacterium GWF2_50_10]|nr:MAG: hypothetical protein A2Y07_07200 [Planctomycetes bacterium GWF2_50_10]